MFQSGPVGAVSEYSAAGRDPQRQCQLFSQRFVLKNYKKREFFSKMLKEYTSYNGRKRPRQRIVTTERALNNLFPTLCVCVYQLMKDGGRG
jgi:hypothetical protein